MECVKCFHVVCKVSSLISPLLKEVKTCIFHYEYLATKVKATLFWDCFWLSCYRSGVQ